MGLKALGRDVPGAARFGSYHQPLDTLPVSSNFVHFEPGFLIGIIQPMDHY